jgi:hypothetical protein
MIDREEIQSKATEMMKKVLTVGVGAIFLTEESLRGLVTEFKLPKELLSGILESAGKTKTDFFQRLSSDVLDRVKDRIDPKALVQEILDKNDLEFHIRLSFKPKNESK